MVLSDLSRSSKKKAAASKRQKKFVTERLLESEGDDAVAGLELHRRTLLEMYGEALGPARKKKQKKSRR